VKFNLYMLLTQTQSTSAFALWTESHLINSYKYDQARCQVER